MDRDHVCARVCLGKGWRCVNSQMRPKDWEAREVPQCPPASSSECRLCLYVPNSTSLHTCKHGPSCLHMHTYTHYCDIWEGVLEKSLCFSAQVQPEPSRTFYTHKEAEDCDMSQGRALCAWGWGEGCHEVPTYLMSQVGSWHRQTDFSEGQGGARSAAVSRRAVWFTGGRRP